MNEQQQNNRAWVETFYRDLNTLVDTTFPRKCPNCGKVYADKASFLTETIPVRDLALEARSGLFSLEEGAAEAAVGLFRNCTCGTTIMVDFRDRRDNSQDGQVRRGRFSRLMDMLVGKGLSTQEARLELLAVLRGDESTRISNLIGEIDLDKDHAVSRRPSTMDQQQERMDESSTSSLPV